MELEMDELDTIVKPSDLSTDDTDARSLAPEPSESPQAREEVRGPSIKAYLAKFGGAGVAGPPRPPLTQTGFSFFGSFTGIALLGLIHTYLLPAVSSEHLVMLVGSFGAMAVLVFSQPKAPLAQPKNAILGNTIGGIVGVTVVKVAAVAGLGHMMWLSAALAVSLTIALQELTTSAHPPGGATALLFVMIPPLHVLGYVYVACPAFLGAVVMVAVGLATNNLSQARIYPQGWSCWDAAQQLPVASATEVGLSPITRYLKKFAGAGVAGPPRPPLTQTGFSFFGSFTGIALLGLVHTYLLPAMPSTHLVMMIGSFGAMAVLVFGQPKAPLAQPKNAILGNTIGGIVGVTVVKVMALAGVGHMLWLIGALAVSLTIVLQELTTSVHPPGGATSLIFAITPPLQVLGYAYVLCPAFLGAVILVAVGLITNNLSESRQYPQGWW